MRSGEQLTEHERFFLKFGTRSDELAELLGEDRPTTVDNGRVISDTGSWPARRPAIMDS